MTDDPTQDRINRIRERLTDAWTLGANIDRVGHDMTSITKFPSRPAKGQKRTFVLFLNNCSAREACICCGNEHKPPVGLCVTTLEDGLRTVCDDCTRRFAPELAEVLSHLAGWCPGSSGQSPA